MYLYHLTLQAPTRISHCVSGNFLGTSLAHSSSPPETTKGENDNLHKVDRNDGIGSLGEQIAMVRPPGWLELVLIDRETGKPHIYGHRCNLFGAVRSLAVFRALPPSTHHSSIIDEDDAGRSGQKKDLLVVGSDSGSVAVLEFDLESAGWRSIMLEPFGRSGLRRSIPGQYVVIDPLNQAILVASLDHQRLFYTIEGRQQGFLEEDGKKGKGASSWSLSDPIESVVPGTLVFDVVALSRRDEENPLFAFLEVDYHEEQQQTNNLGKIVSFWEVELSLGTVFERRGPVEDVSVGADAYRIIALPGNLGLVVLRAATRHLEWLRMGGRKPTRTIEITRKQIPLPPSSGFITSHAIISNVLPVHLSCILLLQDEMGSVFAVNFCSKDDISANPGPSVHCYPEDNPLSLCVRSSLLFLPQGFLFAPSESSQSHTIFHLQSFSEESSVLVWEECGSMPNLGPCASAQLLSQKSNIDDDGRGREWSSGAANLYVARGYGPNGASSLACLQWGISVGEIASSDMTSSLFFSNLSNTDDSVKHGNLIDGLWTLVDESRKETCGIVLSTPLKQTCVLCVTGEEGGVEEIKDNSSFLKTSSSTLGIFQMADGSVVKVHGGGFRQVRLAWAGIQLSEVLNPKAARSIPRAAIVEHALPSDASYVLAAGNARQLVMVLEKAKKHHLSYWELNEEGVLVEHCVTKALPSPCTCLTLGMVPHGRLRSPFLVIGCEDEAVRVFSLVMASSSTLAVVIKNLADLHPVAVQALTAAPTSLALVTKTRPPTFQPSLLLFIGLGSGILIQMAVHPLRGTLANPRAVQLMPDGALKILNFATSDGVEDEHVFILHSQCTFVQRNWGDCDHASIRTAPLLDGPFVHVMPFRSSSFPHALIGVTRDWQLKIVSLAEGVEGRNLDADVAFAPTNHIPLPAQPRECLFRDDRFFIRTLNPRDDNNSWLGDWLSVNPRDNTWASLLPEPQQQQTLTTACLLTFFSGSSSESEQYMLLGVARGFQMAPRQSTSNALHLFRWTQTANFTGWSLVHSTPIEDIPTCAVSFDGRLLVAVGSALRLYDLGQRKLLRKCECRLPSFVTNLSHQGRRIFVADARESVQFVLYVPESKRLLLLADDVVPRMCTAAMALLDHDTVAFGDKFGNLVVLRLPTALSEDLDAEPTASKFLHAVDTGTDGSAGFGSGQTLALGGAPFKFERVAEYHLGDAIISLHRMKWRESSKECLAYCTVNGSLGVFLPLSTQSTTLFLQNLTLALRNPSNPITSLPDSPAISIAELQRRQRLVMPLGRDHLKWRSAYVPQRAVIDGDFCEAAWSIVEQQQGRWAADVAKALELSGGVQEVKRRLGELRDAIGL